MATEGRSPTAPWEAAGDTGRTAGGTIGDALEEAARHWGAATALVAPGHDGARRTWSFVELRNEAKRVARALLRRYRSGEHVAIWAADLPAWPLVEFVRHWPD